MRQAPACGRGSDAQETGKKEGPASGANEGRDADEEGDRGCNNPPVLQQGADDMGSPSGEERRPPRGRSGPSHALLSRVIPLQSDSLESKGLFQLLNGTELLLRRCPWRIS